MSYFANRLVGTVAGLALVSALLVSCSDEATAPATTAASSKASTATTTSSTPSPSESRVIPVVPPSLGSKWTPPAESPAEVEGYKKKIADGFRVAHQDPDEFPEPMNPTRFKAPDAPAISEGPTEQLAVDSANYFFLGMQNYIYTKEPGTWATRLGSDCKFCTGLKKEYDYYFEQGGYSYLNQVHMRNARVVHSEGSEFYVDADVEIQQITTYFPKTSTVLTSPDLSGAWRIKLVWNESGNFIVANAGRQNA